MIWAALAVLLLPQKLRVGSKTAAGIVCVLNKEGPALPTSAALLFPNLLPLVNAKKWCVTLSSKCIPSDEQGTFSI